MSKEKYTIYTGGCTLAEAQYSNFETIKTNQDLIESMIKSFMEKSGSMQQQMMEKIDKLENDVKEIKKILKEPE